jgi:hypothetical protein
VTRVVDSGDAAAEGVAVPLITLVDYRFVPCRVVPFLVCAVMLTKVRCRLLVEAIG